MVHALRRAPGQAGASLLEALVVVVLVSSVVLVLAYGFQFTTENDSRTNRQQRLNAALTSASEAIASNEIGYVVCCPGNPCDFGSYNGLYSDMAEYYAGRSVNLVPDNARANVQVVGFSYWSPGDYTSSPTVPGSYSSSCNPNATSIKLRLRVKFSADPTVLEGEVIKRRPLPGEGS